MRCGSGLGGTKVESKRHVQMVGYGLVHEAKNRFKCARFGLFGVYTTLKSLVCQDQ